MLQTVNWNQLQVGTNALGNPRRKPRAVGSGPKNRFEPAESENASRTCTAALSIAIVNVGFDVMVNRFGVDGLPVLSSLVRRR